MSLLRHSTLFSVASRAPKHFKAGCKVPIPSSCVWVYTSDLMRKAYEDLFHLLPLLDTMLDNEMSLLLSTRLFVLNTGSV